MSKERTRQTINPFIPVSSNFTSEDNTSLLDVVVTGAMQGVLKPAGVTLENAGDIIGSEKLSDLGRSAITLDRQLTASNLERQEDPTSLGAVAGGVTEQLLALTPTILAGGVTGGTIGAQFGPLGAGVGGAIGAGVATYGVVTGTEKNRLIEAGVEAGDAVQAARISGGLAAFGTVLPAAIGLRAGATFLKAVAASGQVPSKVMATLASRNTADFGLRIATGGGINVGLGVGERVAVHEFLEKKGYKEVAEQYKAWDTVAAMTDFTLGALFGGFSHLGYRGQTGEIRSIYDSTLMMEAFDAVEDFIRYDGINAIPKTTEAVELHAKARDTALEQVMLGKKVDVSQVFEGRNLQDLFDYTEIDDTPIRSDFLTEVDDTPYVMRGVDQTDVLLGDGEPPITLENLARGVVESTVFKGYSDVFQRVLDRVKNDPDILVNDEFFDAAGETVQRKVPAREFIEREEKLLTELAEQKRQNAVQNAVSCMLQKGNM